MKMRAVKGREENGGEWRGRDEEVTVTEDTVERRKKGKKKPREYK